jgi:hypothetical protein
MILSVIRISEGSLVQNNEEQNLCEPPDVGGEGPAYVISMNYGGIDN